MRPYIMGLIILVLALISPLNAQVKYRLYFPFKEGNPQVVQAKHSQYLLYNYKCPAFEATYFYKEGNKLSMYQAPYQLRPYRDEMFTKLSSEELFERIFYKNLHPYYKDLTEEEVKLQGVGCTIFPKLDGIIREIMYDATPTTLKRVPIEAFERLEAEIMLNNFKVEFNQDPDLLNGADWISDKFLRFGEDIRDYSKEIEGKHYENLPIVINQRRVEPDRAEIIKKIFRYAYRELWDTAKFRYFTPEIMCRLIFDVERGAEYFDGAKFNYFYKDGMFSNLLLPMDKRARITVATDVRATSTEHAVYQILYQEEAYRGMSDAVFATETLIRLMQTYLSYELMIEAYLDPKVKAYLTDQDWFKGNFARTLKYYAQVKGLNLRELVRAAVEELEQVLNALDLDDTYEAQDVLRQHFAGLKF